MTGIRTKSNRLNGKPHHEPAPDAEAVRRDVLLWWANASAILSNLSDQVQAIQREARREGSPLAGIDMTDLDGAAVSLDGASTVFMNIPAGLVASIPDPLAALQGGG
jgi:hypothetical protein